MKVLVTGASGLIGSHLVPLLTSEHELITVSTRSQEKNNINIDFSKEWSTDLLPSGLDAIIHLAQFGNFRDFPAKATEIFNTNTVSTLKLAQFAVEARVKKIIYASSGGVYGNGEQAFKEEQKIVYDPAMRFYIASKHCSEVILDNYTQLLDVIQLRFFFVYGKGQRKDMLIPRLINNVVEGKPINLTGNDGIKINPIHVTDAARAINTALHLQGSHKINVAGQEIFSIREIAGTIGKLTAAKPKFITDEKTASKNLIGDISKMKELLISPEVKLEDGVKTLINE
jgi:UDP-glucose 4-epimerase